MNQHTHNSDRFTYDKKTNTFSAFVSDLGPKPFGRLYSDACDEGIVILAAKTLNMASFYVVHEERDGEGDLVAWHLLPTTETVRTYPALTTSKVVIFND